MAMVDINNEEIFKQSLFKIQKLILISLLHHSKCYLYANLETRRIYFFSFVFFVLYKMLSEHCKEHSFPITLLQHGKLNE